MLSIQYSNFILNSSNYTVKKKTKEKTKESVWFFTPWRPELSKRCSRAKQIKTTYMRNDNEWDNNETWGMSGTINEWEPELSKRCSKKKN